MRRRLRVSHVEVAHVSTPWAHHRSDRRLAAKVLLEHNNSCLFQITVEQLPGCASFFEDLKFGTASVHYLQSLPIIFSLALQAEPGHQIESRSGRRPRSR